MAKTVPTIPVFVARCDAFCAKFNRSRAWMSKKLFDDTGKLDALASGEADVGVQLLGQLVVFLGQLERADPADHPSMERPARRFKKRSAAEAA